jgi:acetyl esterase/lipase
LKDNYGIKYLKGDKMTSYNVNTRSAKVKFKEVSVLGRFYFILTILNILSAILNAVYIIRPRASAFSTFSAVLLMITLTANILAMYQNKGLNKLKYIYLFVSTFMIMLLPLVNTALSMTIVKNANLISYLVLLVPLLLGTLICAKEVKLISLNQEFNREGKKADKIIVRIVKVLFLPINGLLVVGGLSYSYLLTVKDKGFFGVIGSQFSVFEAFAFLGSAVITIKLLGDGKKVIKAIVLAAGTLSFIVCLTPLILMPKAISDAEESFTTAFSKQWIGNVEEKVEQYFMNSRFSLAEYTFGKSPNSYDYKVKKDVQYYKDDKVTLYFDAYMPPENSKDLPGKGSTLIRVHGGAWVSGDKGAQNMGQVNAYFASQGYVVFDIQYGLNNVAQFSMQGVTPEYVKGDFSINDMVTHIGKFIKYFEQHADEYGAGTNSVFLSGGSAGGHLVTAVGLGITSGKYKDILDANIKIKGLIPFYPANGSPTNLGIGGDYALINPGQLIDKNSPPTLIYQGTKDGLVDPEKTEKFREEYLEKASEKCAVLSMPLAGHGSDLYYSVYYNQLFMYYMERFMYTYRGM